MAVGSLDLFSGVLPFVTAAEAKSFRVAARKLGLTPSAVSKAITRLETRLGLRLLNRSSRSVSLTEEGETFLRGCQKAIVNVRSAEEQVVQAQRALSEVRWVTVAAPAYLAQRGIPRTPGELAAHNCLKFVLPDGTAQEWQFAAPGAESTIVKTDGSLSCDHGEALIEAACAGIGVFQAHDYAVAVALAAGRLVEVLPDYSTPGPPISLLVAPGKRRSPKVRAFVELMLDTVGARG